MELVLVNVHLSVPVCVGTSKQISMKTEKKKRKPKGHNMNLWILKKIDR